MRSTHDMRSTYEFKIKEILERTVRVDADSESEAESIVKNLYNNEKIILDADDLGYSEIEIKDVYNNVINENEGIEHYTNNNNKIVNKFN